MTRPISRCRNRLCLVGGRAGAAAAMPQSNALRRLPKRPSRPTAGARRIGPGPTLPADDVARLIPAGAAAGVVAEREQRLSVTFDAVRSRRGVARLIEAVLALLERLVPAVRHTDQAVTARTPVPRCVWRAPAALAGLLASPAHAAALDEAALRALSSAASSASRASGQGMRSCSSLTLAPQRPLRRPSKTSLSAGVSSASSASPC